MPKIVCVIPARLQSSRFPRKILALLHHKPLIQWVWEAAQRVSLFDSVTIAVDAEETARVVRGFGGHCVMTSESCPTGTSRICEMVRRQAIEADIVVNWQGDEPFLHEAVIAQLLQTVGKESGEIWTLKKRLAHPDDLASPHIVKVVTDCRGNALYFSRAPIPYNVCPLAIHYQHMGIYAYTLQSLQRLDHLPPSLLAEAEQLEQLNFLYHGLKIKVHETECASFGIDTPEHLAHAHSLCVE